MKRQDTAPDQKQKAANTPPAAVVALHPERTVLKPAPDAVAKQAYFSYLNEGSLPGHEARHWLEAEARLLAGIEREMKVRG